MVDGRVFNKAGSALLKARALHRVIVFGSSSGQLPTSMPALARILVGGLRCTQEQVRYAHGTPG